MNTADMPHQDRDIEDMREAGDAANYAHTSSSPGFTAINHYSPQLSLLPQASPISPAQPTSAKATSTEKSSRRRNPTVASYLGLGDSDEPAHLIEYAPTPDGRPPPLQPTRKRRSTRNAEKAAPWKKPTMCSKAATSGRRVIDPLRVIKAAAKSDVQKLKGTTEGHVPTSAITAPCEDSRQNDHREADLRDATKEISNVPGVDHSSRYPSAPIVDDEEDAFGQLCFEFELNSRNADSSIPSTYISEQPACSQTPFGDEDLDDGLMDEDLLDLMTDTRGDPSSPVCQSKSPIKINILEGPGQPQQRLEASVMSENASNEGISSSSCSSKKFVSPVTLTSRMLAATGDEARKPIVRPLFPTAVRDRSPIIGMSSNTVLRSCFRVGEAISQSCRAAKAGNNILIELYARVLNSGRDDLQQQFTFCDLFHAKPPYIQATYAAAIWKSVQLFEYDSARLMQPGRICRCVGSMKRNGKDWVMTVQNIWEATWDDVQWVEGIVNS